ncbi:protein of unknown function [Mucilaginibacter pineti]|uniref:DUF4468 domain-containing protein n=1 Tax=Mucilaginibacter pineti TaxID=1391627 RepID=A0A1G7BHP0_9SPHI|nr:DUF4468 domain-containing protein [Mucilaginibacter pineti]SDE25956.1 protein of unknown function [Mucilaginibacter pineti]
MKNLIIALTCILFAKTVSAQTDSLAFDENNKYIYYQTVEQAGLNKDTLYTRALYFIKKSVTGNKLKLSKADEVLGTLTGKGSFMITKKTLVLAGVGGEIDYSLRIEVKDAKYRYWFTDFVFIPYQRDRYGMDVPTPGVYIPLENAKRKIDAKDVAAYLDKILQNSRQVGSVLKSYMLKISSMPKPKADKAIKKISTKEW